MPRIFDNIEQQLAPTLVQALSSARRADICVGYFNLRGWHLLAETVDALEPHEGRAPCRVLIGMHATPQELQRAFNPVSATTDGVDQQRALQLKRQVTEDFYRQLASGVPSRKDESTLRHLARQLRERRMEVKLHLRERLHAKLYLVHRKDTLNPHIGFLGSSNLTFSGLKNQGELNVDVMEVDACQKLARWFEDRWNDRFSLDVSEDLARAIEESWASERLVHPYHVYLKIVWHLSREARAGLTEFTIPKDIDEHLFDFQRAAVKIAAHHVKARGGVMLGDVVGLGKTLMATALARVLDEDLGYHALIVCPKNLVPMWEDHVRRHRVRARVLSLGMVQKELPNLPRYQVVIIDESHNLRNREGRRYRAISDYVRRNESRCILLTATPYNKTYLDIGSQLRLFVAEDRDLGVRPEHLLRDIGGEDVFLQQHQCFPRTLAAFEKSEHVQDWRDLMRLFLVRRTRSFIRRTYAQTDESGRKYLEMRDGRRVFFPDRIPKTIRFQLDEQSPNDPYARLYADDVVLTLNGLKLPRYGLGNHVRKDAKNLATPDERSILDGLSKAGRRLQGFCLSNLFKRLESSGSAFLTSIKRHILRNHVFLAALRAGESIPVGTQDSVLLDETLDDADLDAPLTVDDDEMPTGADPALRIAAADESFATQARIVLDAYRAQFGKRFRWINSALFKPSLIAALEQDTTALLGVLDRAGVWDGAKDSKLDALESLLGQTHAQEKLLVFTQFADTAHYLHRELVARGHTLVECVTGDSEDPTALARRFSPGSNDVQLVPGQEVRVLIATDLLSEGQNLQDASIVVNYDLPWAVIRLVQRAGRVDRIGQQSPTVTCYSFMPSDGVERLLRLRDRMRKRLEENAEVVGTDEAFFDDQNTAQIVDLYHEKAGVLDGQDDDDVDLGSQALQIWNDSIAANPALETIVRRLQPVVHATRAKREEDSRPPGVIVFVRTAHDADALAYVDEEGRTLTSSPSEVLRLAACRADTEALAARTDHHELVAKGVARIVEEEVTLGGQLGPRTGARYRIYERLKRHIGSKQGTLFAPQLQSALDALHRQPLQSTAAETLTKRMRAGDSDAALADFVVLLHEEGRLCFALEQNADGPREPSILCSMGIQ
ncbi:MAG TPA: phospholipase D-like domain-containing protein [Polyangium sp.]|nr:phospholipase D-like domain-containing protein [Polyangium sp.]